MEADEAAQELWVKKKKKCFTVACGTESGTSSLTPHCPVSVNGTQHSLFCFGFFFLGTASLNDVRAAAPDFGFLISNFGRE